MPCNKKIIKVSGTRKTDYKKGEMYENSIILGCGVCVMCMNKRSKEYLAKNFLHYQNNKQAQFITLTYDDKKYIPTLFNQETRRHIENFRKSIKRNNSNFTYFGLAEYGTKYFRPHYHLIIYNNPFEDLTYIGKSKKGVPLYHSDELSKLWSWGFSVVQEFSPLTFKYLNMHQNANSWLKQQTKEDWTKYKEYNFYSPGLGKEQFFKSADYFFALGHISVDTKLPIPQYWLRCAIEEGIASAIDYYERNMHKIKENEKYKGKMLEDIKNKIEKIRDPHYERD